MGFAREENTNSTRLCKSVNMMDCGTLLGMLFTLAEPGPAMSAASLNYCLHGNAKLYKQPRRMSPKVQKYIFRVNLICLQQLPRLRCELFWITNGLLLIGVVQGHLCKYGPFICIMPDARICKVHLVLPGEQSGRKKNTMWAGLRKFHQKWCLWSLTSPLEPSRWLLWIQACFLTVQFSTYNGTLVPTVHLWYGWVQHLFICTEG